MYTGGFNAPAITVEVDASVEDADAAILEGASMIKGMVTMNYSL